MKDEGRIALRDTIGLIEAELPNLQASTRQVFLLRHARHMSYEEIAQQLGMSKRTVEREMVKALTHLQLALGDALKDILE